MKKNIWLTLLLVLSAVACRKDPAYIEKTAYHIVLVCGQSNTHFGNGFDPTLDAPHHQILQLGRFGNQDTSIILAEQPLHHHTKLDGAIGFAMTFSKLYVDAYMEEDERLLIIPCGASGTGFKKGNWNKGNHLYEDAVYRYHLVRNKFPQSHLSAILWHQGESDIKNQEFQADLDRFIADFRSDLMTPEVPFILGGMNPYWVEKDSRRIALQNILKDTPNRIPNTGYADPTSPEVILKDSNEVNAIHYDAQGLRELGRRYFSVYTTLHQ